MICLFFEGLVRNHLNKDTLEKFDKSSNMRKTIFNNLTLGVNVVSVGIYQDVAAWLLTVPEEKLKELTIEDVIENVGDYIDNSGYLV